MKKFALVLIPLLCIMLFFACSNEGLDVVKGPEKISCYVVEQEGSEGTCHNISKEMCAAVDGEEYHPNCASSSSASDPGNLSSSSEATEFGCWTDEEACYTLPIGSFNELACERDGGLVANDCDERKPKPSSSSVRRSSSSVESGSSSSIADGSSSSVVVGGGSSSSTSIIAGGSSSSLVITVSSSSVDGPQTTGSFEFRFFDYSSNSSKIYFLKTNYMYASTTVQGGQGKLLHTLAIASGVTGCGAVTIEVTGLAGTTMPTSNPATSPVTTVGEITAKAVATCNGTKYTLATATATVVADPIFSDCALPSTYLYRNESVKNLVTVVDDYGRCTNATIAYSPAVYSTSASSTAQTLSITASCNTGTFSYTKQCSGLDVAAVANNFLRFEVDEQNVKKPIQNGTTVIELLDEYEDSDGSMKSVKDIGCESMPPGLNQTTIKLNGTGYDPDWWVLKALPANYKTNGYRILLEKVNSEAAQCAVMF